MFNSGIIYLPKLVDVHQFTMVSWNPVSSISWILRDLCRPSCTTTTSYKAYAYQVVVHTSWLYRKLILTELTMLLLASRSHQIWSLYLFHTFSTPWCTCMIVNKIGIAFSTYGGPLHFYYEIRDFLPCTISNHYWNTYTLNLKP